MKKFPFFLLLTFFNILVSCRHEKKMLPDIPLSSDSSATVSSSSSAKTFKGLFVVGRNILSFRECDHPEKDFAVIDSTRKMKELYQAVFLHSPAFPYEYVYVEVKGNVSAAPDSTVSRGFDSIITVNRVLTFEQKNYQNSCIPYNFWALGKDWSLQVSEKEDIMVLKDFSTMKVYVFEYFPPKSQSDDLFTYASNNYAAGAAIKARIVKEPCTEESSKNEYLYSAKVIINGKIFHGCAIKGSAGQ